MNKVIISGRLTDDPIVINGNITKFTLVLNTKVGDGNRAEFFTCTSFNELGESILKTLYKGIKVAIVGKLHQGRYTDKEGVKRSCIEIYLSEFDIIEHTREYKESHKKQGQQYNNDKNDNNTNNLMDGFCSIDELLRELGENPEDLPFR